MHDEVTRTSWKIRAKDQNKQSGKLHNTRENAMPKITLHTEIQDILIANDNDWMTTREIAEQVNRRACTGRKTVAR